MRRTVTALAIAGTTAALALATPAAARATGLPNIGQGYHNNPHAVWCVQHLVNDWVVNNHVLGYTSRPMPEDADFGNLTTTWVKRAQELWMGLPPDGIVGPQTGQHLIHDTDLTGDDYYGGSGHYCDGFIPTIW